MTLTDAMIIAAYERFYVRELFLNFIDRGLIYGDRASLDTVRRVYTLRTPA